MSQEGTAPVPSTKTEHTKSPKTQEKAGFRANWPEWMRQLPRSSFPTEPNPDFQLIDREEIRRLLQEKKVEPEAIKKLEADMDFLDHELLRLFRERDHEAKLQQNRYRLYQVGFITLAAVATIIGSLQAVMLNGYADLVPLLALIETIIALLTTYLATISGRETPLPRWLSGRRRAEYMRREYFRYLMNMPPYDVVQGYQRRQLLSSRAANINRGVYPDKQQDQD